MQNEILSQWHPVSENPVNNGMYETTTIGGREQPTIWYGAWSIPKVYITKWRGIVRPCPKCGTPMERAGGNLGDWAACPSCDYLDASK
jgi:hypothetical protein